MADNPFNVLDLDPNDPVRVEAMSFVETIEEVAHDSTLMVLRVHLLTEAYLERLILSVVPRGDRLFDGGHVSYYRKLVLVHAFAVLDDRIIQCLKRLNKLRNRLAHELDTKPTKSDIENVGQPLGNKVLAELRRGGAGDCHKLLVEMLGFIVGVLVFVVTKIEGAHSTEPPSSTATEEPG